MIRPLVGSRCEAVLFLVLLIIAVHAIALVTGASLRASGELSGSGFFIFYAWQSFEVRILSPYGSIFNLASCINETVCHG